MAPEPKPEKGKQLGSTGPPSLDAALDNNRIEMSR
jgi:hypothetical protein